VIRLDPPSTLAPYEDFHQLRLDYAIGRYEDATRHRLDAAYFRPPFSKTWPAPVFLGLEDKRQASDRLERAVKAREPGVLETLCDPLLNPLADDPRFLSLRHSFVH
jgi:hypothetical protein